LQLAFPRPATAGFFGPRFRFTPNRPTPDADSLPMSLTLISGQKKGAAAKRPPRQIYLPSILRISTQRGRLGHKRAINISQAHNNLPRKPYI
jgi:hypothetical protein